MRKEAHFQQNFNNSWFFKNILIEQQFLLSCSPNSNHSTRLNDRYVLVCCQSSRLNVYERLSFPYISGGD